MFLTTKDFYTEFTENRHILPYYIKLESNYNTKTFYSLEDDALPISNLKCVSIKLFPKYLTPHFYTDAGIGVKKVFQKDVHGCAIHLTEKTTIDLFLRKEYSKKFRTSINRSVNRFELCFNYSYIMITEGITAEKYRSLMDALHTMLVHRFNQRNEPNDVLANWDHYYALVFNLVNTKKASIFVIYSNDEPINICINYHFNTILFISIASFNPNFSKFSLGNISIYKIIEWSLNNDYELLDMGYGDLEYKRFWSNYMYAYENHIVYSKKINYRFIAAIEVSKIKFKNFLKSYKIAEKRTKLKALLRENKKKLNNSTKYTTTPLTDYITTNLPTLEYDDTSFSLIAKPVYDYLFLQATSIDTIAIFEIEKAKEYLIVGPKAMEKITITA
ncbi:GNAT family N-acetyltransferase [Cellulophaga sp. 20_2_10]|uniref:GNAT family N-acetyltransferase n=1 Tax=Cellulophaga sp. 20_2_10 TaxID=2942476 RepID=UPI00201ACAC4|nr:GNAT family N-acetyltransferase [Cellulophaga sp. 20_2_10]MCL5244798.1 GNAT family N-acetyltransferase [Cellulophaga sp. 20_2_10]